MKKRFLNQRKARKGAKSFDPNSEYIQDAVEQYLRSGGKINRLEPDETSLDSAWVTSDVSSDVDEFLIGQ